MQNFCITLPIFMSFFQRWHRNIFNRAALKKICCKDEPRSGNFICWVLILWDLTTVLKAETFPKPKRDPLEVSPSQDGVCNHLHSHRRGMGLVSGPGTYWYEDPQETSCLWKKILPYWYFGVTWGMFQGSVGIFLDSQKMM